MSGTDGPDRERFERLGTVLSRADLIVLSEAERNALDEEWRDIDNRERELDDRLFAGIVGGTGVGKSTLINALAEEEISSSGDRRPTTDRVVIYRHGETSLPAELPREDLSDPQVVHSREPLERIVLLDFPDFDSVEASHREILSRYLPHLDVLFVVVDDVKYGDRRLFELLSGLPHDPRNLVAVLNKVDCLAARYGSGWPQVVEQIIDDFRAKIRTFSGLDLDPRRFFGISALVRFRRSRAPSRDHESAPAEVEGDFEAVVRELESYRARKRREEAKRLNLSSRKARLFARLREAVLDPLRALLVERAREHLAVWSRELESTLESLAAGVLTEGERRSLRRVHVRALSASWGFPFSLLFTAFAELGRFRGARDGRTLEPESLAGRIREHYRAYFDALLNLQATFGAEFAGTPLARARHAAAEPAAALAGEARWTAGAARELHARLRAPGEGRRRGRALYHLPALLVLGLSLWAVLHGGLKAWRAADAGWLDRAGALFDAALEALDPVRLAGTLLAVLLAYAGTAAYIWLREVQKLEVAVGEGEKRVQDAVRSRGDASIRELELQVSRYEGELRTLRELVGDVSPIAAKDAGGAVAEATGPARGTA